MSNKFNFPSKIRVTCSATRITSVHSLSMTMVLKSNIYRSQF